MKAGTVALFLLTALTAAAAHGAPVGKAGAEAEELMTAMIPVGREMLEKDGKFIPYAGAMTTDGKVVTVAGYSGTKPPPSPEVITTLNATLRSGAVSGTYNATCLFSDVEVVPPGTTEKTHAIAAALDHQDNYSVVIYFPYKIVPGKVEFDTVYASAGENKVFQK